MRLRISTDKRSCPSVRPYVPCYFRTSKNIISEALMTTKVNRDYVPVSKNKDNNDYNNNNYDDDDDNDDDSDEDKNKERQAERWERRQK